MHADETPVTCLDGDCAKGSRKGYLWAYINEKGDVLYEWHMGRSNKCALSMLKGYRGLLQADAYGVYSSLEQSEGFTLIACMAHIRRKFYEAWHDADELSAGWYILQIGELYQIERMLKKNATLDVVDTRRKLSLPILQVIKARLDADNEKLRPQKKTAEAVRYALGVWTNMIRYVDYAQAGIDNNLAERAVRPTKLGMKN